ncbi:MAG: Ig-like domain-containing protein [Smithella sp.]
MDHNRDKWKIVIGAIFLSIFLIIGNAPVQAANQSLNVAIIGSPTVASGGCFPTTVNGFTAFHFFNVNRANVSLANLTNGTACGGAACDTVLLNVANSTGNGGLGCNMNNLSASAKTDLVTFVFQGGKLIIYDSECSTQNYSWLPYPFTTANPGAMGARGQLTIVEDNVLSSANPASPYYLNELLLENNTDAIGDMNVMTTYNPNWCLDMSGTNALNKTGPVHTYARYGNGLIIYNGWDLDYETCSSVPSTTTGPGNLSKTWYQELMVAFNPTPVAALPCGITVVGINLLPATASNDLGKKEYNHTVVAHLSDLLNNPQQGVAVNFTVTGLNAGISGTGISDANGNVSFTYSTGVYVKGQDTITACFTNQAGQQICSQPVTKNWVMKCDLNNDDMINRTDINIIMTGRGQHLPGDPRDIDGDGWITVNDARGCTLQCTKPNCAL